jgi:hypothetical protein
MTDTTNAHTQHHDMETLPLASTFEYEERDLADEHLPSYGEALASARTVDTAPEGPTVGLPSTPDADRLWQRPPCEQMAQVEQPQTNGSCSRNDPSALGTSGNRRPKALIKVLCGFLFVGLAVTMGGVIRYATFDSSLFSAAFVSFPIILIPLLPPYPSTRSDKINPISSFIPSSV